MNNNKHHIVFLTGAGISQESGISTFRDANGLWNNHKIEEVASPEGFEKNPELVLDFYNATQTPYRFFNRSRDQSRKWH